EDMRGDSLKDLVDRAIPFVSQPLSHLCSHTADGSVGSKQSIHWRRYQAVAPCPLHNSDRRQDDGAASAKHGDVRHDARMHIPPVLAEGKRWNEDARSVIGWGVHLGLARSPCLRVAKPSSHLAID